MQRLIVAGFFLAACGKDETTTSESDTATTEVPPTDSGTPADTDTETVPPPVDADQDGFPSDLDCNDADAEVFPGAPDACGDDVVYDCDRLSDDGLVTVDGTATFDDLQVALDAASDGSEVLVCPGTYLGNFVAAVPVRIVGYGLPDVVHLRGQGGSTLSVPAGSEVVSVTVRGGNSPGNGGGLRMTSSGTLLVDSCVITENTAMQGGGLWVTADSTATLVSTSVIDNFAAFGGGGVGVEPNGTVDLSQSSTVTDNVAVFFGGGVWLDGAHLVGGVVSGNTCDSYASISTTNGDIEIDEDVLGGGGVAMSGTSDVTGSEIRSNIGTGAGVSVTKGNGTLIDTLVTDNDATDYYGGGAAVWIGSLTLSGTSSLDANVAYIGGGATLIDGTLTGGTVSNNDASSWGGGVISAYAATMDGVAITGNTAGYAGGGVMVIGSATLTGLVVDGNDAVDSGGGFATLEGYGVYYQDNVVSITASSFTNNTAAAGGGVFSAFPLFLTDVVVSDNTADNGAGLNVVDRAVSMTGGAMLRNAAVATGGGVLVEPGTSFSASGVDFGAGVDDNTPNDARAGGVEYTGYEAAETFTCTPAGCSPVP